MDGIVIGGPAHGQTRDPAKCGPVLVVPKLMRAPARFVDSDDPRLTSPIDDRVEYKLHEFHATDGTDRRRWRVWMPIEVKPHMAFEYMITMALKAPTEDK